jgi:hypothetical protein
VLVVVRIMFVGEEEDQIVRKKKVEDGEEERSGRY